MEHYYPRGSALQSAQIAEQLLKICLYEPYVSEGDREDIRTALRTRWHLDCLQRVDHEAWRLHLSVWLYGAASLLHRLTLYHGGFAAEPAPIAIIRQCLRWSTVPLDNYTDGEPR